MLRAINELRSLLFGSTEIDQSTSQQMSHEHAQSI